MFSQVFIYLCEEVSQTCNLKLSMLMGRGALAALLCLRSKDTTTDFLLLFISILCKYRDPEHGIVTIGIWSRPPEDVVGFLPP